MPLGSTKMLDDFCGEGLLSVGGVKNPSFLCPTKKAQDAWWYLQMDNISNTVNFFYIYYIQ